MRLRRWLMVRSDGLPNDGFATIGQCPFDGRPLGRRELPANGQRIFANLVGAFRSAQGRRDARLMDRPVDHQLRKALTGFGRDWPQAIDQVLVLLPFRALKHRVFVPTVRRGKDMFSRQLAGQQPLQ